MASIWAVVNQKGGVGKTTTAINIAAYLARDRRVLLVDMDPQGNATSGLGVADRDRDRDTYTVLLGEHTIAETAVATAVPGLQVVPGSINLAGAEIALLGRDNKEYVLRNALDEVRDQYDFVIIDSPPSLGALTVNTLVAADHVLVPLQCEYFALEGVSQLIEIVHRVRAHFNPDLAVARVVLTLFDGRTNLAQQVMQEVRSYFGDIVSPTVVPRNVRLSEAPSFGRPISLYDPRSKGALAYEQISQEIKQYEQGEAGNRTAEGARQGTGRSTARWWRR
ncbi:MAG: ParA family protein [Armatimonadaceae bacterium]|jgi:chromosome partitioning protein